MNRNELAAKLNGRQIGNEISEQESKEAAANNLIVIFGYSDDNMEVRGLINDEFGCYEGDDFFFHRGGVLTDPSGGDCEHCAERLNKLSKHCAKVRAVWNLNGDSWTYETAIPHATFEIVEDGSPYCRGIVFHVDDLPII